MTTLDDLFREYLTGLNPVMTQMTARVIRQ